jgi:branched-subunit amino acid ABC-type transport system permease component
MKTTPQKVIGWFLILIGVLIIVFSRKIVFLGLERLVSKEAFVYFTNPAAMTHWIAMVVTVGLLVCLTGIWILIRARTGRKISN